MFDKLKSMSQLTGLLKNQEKLREIPSRVKDRMENTKFIGEAGQGAVRCVMTGGFKVLEVELAASLAAGISADDTTRRLAGTLVAEAMNQALTRVQNTFKEELEKEVRALGLGDLSPEIGNMLGM